MAGKKHSIERAVSIGQQFGFWTVIKVIDYTVKKHRVAECRCACGAEKQVRIGKLLAGESESCGCQQRANLITHGRTTAEARETSREYWIWNSMVQRCTNEKNKGFHNYGGRGITVCDRWLKFENFYADMGPKPEGMSIERRDNDAGYSPENCCWIPRGSQNRNRRISRMITANGSEKCITEWARKLGVSHATIIARINNGWPEDKAVTLPKGSQYIRSM